MQDLEYTMNVPRVRVCNGHSHVAPLEISMSSKDSTASLSHNAALCTVLENELTQTLLQLHEAFITVCAIGPADLKQYSPLIHFATHLRSNYSHATRITRYHWASALLSRRQ